MKKDFIVSKIEAPQDGSQYVFIAFTDPNEPKSSGGSGAGNSYPQSPLGKSGEALPFTSPEDIIKNLPKVMSNTLVAGGGMQGNSPTFKITMKEYEDMAIKVGGQVEIEINKVYHIGT
jgi:hypothetical protein